MAQNTFDFSYFWGKLSTILAGKQATLTFDTTPTKDSQNPVTSGGIYDRFIKRTIIPAGTSLNTITDFGTYYQTDALSGFTGAPADAPAAAFILEVSARDANTRVEQMIKTYDSTTGERIIYARVQTGASTWGAWCRYVDSVWVSYNVLQTSSSVASKIDTQTSTATLKVNYALKMAVLNASIDFIADIATGSWVNFATLSGITGWANICPSAVVRTYAMSSDGYTAMVYKGVSTSAVVAVQTMSGTITSGTKLSVQLVWSFA